MTTADRPVPTPNLCNERELRRAVTDELTLAALAGVPISRNEALENAARASTELIEQRIEHLLATGASVDEIMLAAAPWQPAQTSRFLRDRFWVPAPEVYRAARTLGMSLVDARAIAGWGV